MLDLLSPLRGYIAQNLQFYLGKYIEDIQLEGLGLFGGDLVLNDLEIKRHVLRESLEIPSSFDFSRGFIRELRIHIPWTQLLSQPIEVKLYTIELILTARNSTASANSVDAAVNRETEIDQPKSGWVHDTLHKILANVSLQINNLVLKYEHDDVVFSIALGTLDFYSASEENGWKRSFEELKGGRRDICKRIDAKDVTIFLDRYTNNEDARDDARQSLLRRRVVGYEVPVLSRTSASVRAKLELFNKAGQSAPRSKSTSPLNQDRSNSRVANNIVDVDGLFTYKPSVLCDPFYYYLCNRSSVIPMYELDVFIGELPFSVSDRQLEMLSQLIQSASHRFDQAQERVPSARNDDYLPDWVNKNKSFSACSIPVEHPQKYQVNDQVGSLPNKHEPWFGWVMNALGTAENEEEDALMSELLAETRGALIQHQSPANEINESLFAPRDPVTTMSCVRVCVSLASLTLRKHELNVQVEYQDATKVESSEEFVPVANLGMVKVSTHPRRNIVARPAMPILYLTLSYVALEVLIARGQEQCGTDLVFEIEKAEIVSATNGTNGEDTIRKNEGVLLTWGSIDATHISDCVSHPYFISSFFEEELTRLNQRKTRSFDIVKVAPDAGIPVWTTLKTDRRRMDSRESQSSPCECYFTWNGKAVRCTSTSAISKICQKAIEMIGIKERVLDDGIILDAVSTAWNSSEFSLMITEEMTLALTAAAEEYRAHRNPDLGSSDNLVQLLLPQLVALCCRHLGHSCLAASLHSPPGSVEIQHRSVHSALRMRSASNLKITEHDVSSPDHRTKEEAVKKIMDVSIGAAKAVLDPLKCLVLLESLSILLRENEKDDVKVPKRINVSTPATKNLAPETMEAPDIISITLSDVKLITVSNVHVHFPDQRSGLGRSLDYCGGLNLIGSDFVWLGNFYPGSSKNRLQFGALTAYLGEAQSDFTDAPLVEALGSELMNTLTYADGGSNDVLFASLVKARIDLSLSALYHVATVVSDVASLLGYAIALEPIKIASEKLHTSFQIEVCQPGLSRTVSHRPRAVMAQCQSLSGGIASVSVTWKRRKTDENTVIFQGGIAAMMRNDSKPRTSFFKFDILYEKTSGKLVGVPIISSLGMLTLKPDLVSTKCRYCQLSVKAHLAYLDLDLQGVLHLIGIALSFLKEFSAALPGKATSTPKCERFGKDALDGNQASCTSTGWSFVIDMKAGGCGVSVNEALQLTLSQISLVTTEKELKSTEFVRPGGVLYLEFVAKGATLFASDSGSLKGIQDPIVLSTEEFGALVDFSHENADSRHNYAFNVMFHASSIQASLSRLKLLYLSKIPNIEDEAILRDVTTYNAPHLHKLDKRECNDHSSTPCRWFWRLGAQLDLADFTCTADIYHCSDCKKKRIRADVNGKMHNMNLAARISNYHPTKNHHNPTMQEKFTDIQLSVGNVEVVEVHACENICTKLGDFSRLSNGVFMGILVCLDLSDLKVLSKTLRAVDTSINFDQESLPPAMVSWHLTNTISKTFQEIKAKWHQSKADRHHSFSKIPLVVAWNDPVLSKGPLSFPLLSGFYRNYSEVSLPHQVVAGSMDSVDFVMTTSSLLCLASLLNVRGKKNSKPVIERNEYGAACNTGVPKVSAYNTNGLTSRVSLANIELSLLFGKVRIIFPNVNLMDYVQSNQQVVPGNVVMVLESMSMVSAVRNDISLDGLGYPPFNSRILPRRPAVQAQRFGQSQLQIGCRAGKISAFVAELNFSPEVATLTNNFDVVGPFEEYIGSVVGHLALFTNAEAILSPLNVTCSIEEEILAKTEGRSSAAKITISIAMTKLRLQLNEQLFDVLYARYAGIYRGAYNFRQFFASAPPVQLRPRHTEESSELSTTSTSSNQLEITFSSDGIDINVIEIDISTHFRIGLIVFVHNTVDLSGSASIQNIVAGHRIYKNETETVAVEEVVFGAKAEPSLWQLAVENYPEKLFVARWKFGDRSQGTLFLDVQAYQLHISHHFICALARFYRTESHILKCSRWEGQHSECSVQTVDRKPFLLKGRWNVKLLVAPSVVSYWRLHSTDGRKTGVWLTSGQLFASMGIGSDEVAQQSLSMYGSAVNEINRYIAVPTLKLMLNLDKFGLHISDDLPPLIVLFQKNSVSPITIPTSSTWPQFVKYISILSESQRFLQDCSLRVTGGQHQLLERVAIGDEILLLYTGIARTNMQAEVNALCMKLSSSSLGAIQSLLSTLGGKGADVQTVSLSDERNANDDVTHKSFPSQKSVECPTDDFKDLKRMAESRRPLPGELVFTEALFIETQTIVSDYSPPVVGCKIYIQIDPNRFDLKLADVAAFLEDCNKPWNVEEPGPTVERSSNSDFTNRTHSYMGMRWCYHVPRKICKIVANPVPIPPDGVPSAWPLWNWNQDQEGDVCRLCDILCQLRCWDSKNSSYVVVGEFCVPWEQMASAANSSDLDDVNEFGSFGELMNQWFDDNKEEVLFRAKLLEFGARTRTYTFENNFSSDNWELRWRAPFESEHDPKNKQMRLLINALLASSLQVQSVLNFDAYQRVVSSITFPRVSLSVSHVGPENVSHDIITAEFYDTEISCLVVGTKHTRILNIQVLSGLQVYLNNMTQLLTASVIPRTTIDALAEISAKGMKVSTVIGPVSLYLNQTSMLVLSAIPRLLVADQKPPDENLSSMRIKITNFTGVDVWYRQDETLECLFLPAEASAAYSWLSLASSPYYQLCFAVDDPRQEQFGRTKMDKNLSEQNSFWCDPCRIKENCVTGRYFSGYGFVWICVELCGLQTNVLLRSSLTVSNYCDFPVRFKVNNGATIYQCIRSGSLSERVSAIRESVACTHPHCFSLDGSACTLSTLLQSDESVARVMTESVTTIRFAIDGGSWCDVETRPRIPSAFDNVKGSDNNSLEKGQYEFISLYHDSPDESTQYVWAKIARATCKTVLPTDNDPLQPQISERFTWMELSLWPAIIAQNFTEAFVFLSFTQNSTLNKLNLPPSGEKCLSTINPLEPFKIVLKYDQVSSSADTNFARPEYEFQCTISEKLEEQMFVFKDCRVVVGFCDGRKPMIRIKTECVLSIANMTPKDLTIKFTYSFEDRNGILEKVESCDERFIGFAAVSDRLIIAVATIADPSNKFDQVSWSPGVSLDVKGETKLIVVPAAEAGLKSLASAFCIELVNSEGYIKLTIRPQVVVINATSCNLNCMPTDGRGNALSENDELTLVSGDNAGWSAPVCLHKKAKKRSMTADVTSWLNSKLSKRSSEVESNARKQALMARLSCSFRIRLTEGEYEWTEEVVVQLLKQPLELTSDGRLEHVNPPKSSMASANTQEELYPPPSTTTYRRRLLIRHRSFKHKMLTYTMTQIGKSICIMFFVDHQPPVIIHNEWQHMLSFCNADFPSIPEGIGANFCMEYDWDLQISAKNREFNSKPTTTYDKRLDEEGKLLSEWLEISSHSFENADLLDTRTNEHTRFQIGLPQYGWSNVLWQIGGIQFASFYNDDKSVTAKLRPTFLVTSFYRAGSWLISIICVEDPTSDSLTKSPPLLALPSATSSVDTRQIALPFLKVSVLVEELSLHFCDEHDPIRGVREMILYPEIVRVTCNTVSIAFVTAQDPPEISRYNARLGYLSHIRSFTSLFVSLRHIEVGHFLQACNFPVIFWFTGIHAKKPLLEIDRVKKHKNLENLMNNVLNKQLPGAENPCLITRVIYADTKDPVSIPPYFHSVELKVSPAVLQVEDDILVYVNAFVQPIWAALEGKAIRRTLHDIKFRKIATKSDAWSSLVYKSAMITMQRKVYVEYLGISDLQLTITARVSIPVLNSFDGTPLHFGRTEMRELFSFPDQLYKDLAAEFVADTIVRSPMLLMSLNILGNPAGFLRSFSSGVRDLIEIPVAASRNGYGPWVLTKGVLSGVASFLSHTTAGTLTSVSGFSYSISRTLDQLTLPSDQLRKRHYKRPTQLSSAIADGLGLLGSSVVGAATGVVTTPIAVYKERQTQGLESGFRNVVGSVGMGLVGIVARPIGGVASLVSLASDGLLHGIEESRIPFDDSTSRFNARPNELLRYKLKVLSDAIGSHLVFAHGLWINPQENSLLTSQQDVNYIVKEQLELSENESLYSLLLPRDATLQLLQVTVVCSNECVYVVGVTASQIQAVLARVLLKSIEAVEEDLKEPTVFDLGIKTSASAEWLRFRLPPLQRRHISNQLRLWLNEDSNLLF